MTLLMMLRGLKPEACETEAAARTVMRMLVICMFAVESLLGWKGGSGSGSGSGSEVEG